MVDVSVIVCTHNPRPDYFASCLDALRGQQTAIEWELLVVDNLSDPPISPDLSWHRRARVLREERLGLTPARLRGIAETAGDLLVFVDDDNVLESGYLQAAYETAVRMPFIGAWSGQCHPRFEVTPQEWTRRYWGNLVIRSFERDVWSNLPRLADSMPCGAGLCVRRGVAERYRHLHESGRRTIQFDRRGDSLLSGGDNDLAACACELGLGVGLIAALRLTHLISARRVTEDYLARLAESIGFSSVLLDHEYGIETRPRSAVGRIADMMRAMREKGPHRRILRAAQRGRDRAAILLASRQDPGSRGAR